MDLPTALHDIITTAHEPLTAAEIAARAEVKLGQALASKDILAALKALEQTGRIFGFKGFRPGNLAPCYSTRRADDLASEALAHIVSKLPAPLAPAKLKPLLAKPLRPWFDEALGRLIVHGQAYYLTQGKTKLVQAHAPRPSDFITAPLLAQLKKLLDQTNRLRRTPRTLEELLAWLDDESQEPIHIIPRPLARRGITSDQLRAWHQADAGKSSTRMVPLPDTYARYQAWAKLANEPIDIEIFKKAIREQYEAGTLMLEPHERPHELPADHRALQVPMSLGPPGFYWGLLES